MLASKSKRRTKGQAFRGKTELIHHEFSMVEWLGIG